MNDCLKCSQKVLRMELKIGSRWNASETVGIYGNHYKAIKIQKSMDNLHLHRLKDDSKCS